MASNIPHFLRNALALSCGLAVFLIAGCSGPDPLDSREGRRATMALQPFVDQILETQATEGRYPSNLDALFFRHSWPEYTITRHTGHPRLNPDSEYAIVSPKSNPSVRLIVSYTLNLGDAELVLLQFGSPPCSWRSMNMEWGCPRNT
ncbi:MAG: hypothetical protein ACK5LJ_05985 [Paracoccus sp. (in: a-proteobacteria)]